MYDYAVVIGRFQIPHHGHFALIEKALEQAETVIVCVGSSNLRRNLRNPFSFEQRVSFLENSEHKAITDALASHRLAFLPLEDSPYDEQWWIEHVQRQVKRFVSSSGKTDATIALVGCNKDDSTFYLKWFPQWDYIEIKQEKILNATDLRHSYYLYGPNDKSLHNTLGDHTTQGVIRALGYVPTQTWQELHNRYKWVLNYREEWGAGPFETADAVVLKAGHVLLIERGQDPDKGALAFPGGFVDRAKDDFPHRTALRELEEETGLKLNPCEDYVDYPPYRYYTTPFRDDRGDIRTHAYLFKLPDEGALPKVEGLDDAAEARWVPLSDITASNMFADHYFVLRDLMKKL